MGAAVLKFVSLLVVLAGGTFATSAISAASCSPTLTASYPAPSLADGYVARLLANDLTDPRGIKFDIHGALLVVEPSIGITAPLWGIVWYLGLQIYGWRAHRRLVVKREAFWSRDPDYPSEYIQKAEIIDHRWQIVLNDEMSEDFPPREFRMDDREGSASEHRRRSTDSDEEDGVEQSGRRTRTRWLKPKGVKRLANSFEG